MAKIICKGHKTCLSKKDCPHAKPHDANIACEKNNDLPDSCTCSESALLKKERLKKLKKINKIRWKINFFK